MLRSEKIFETYYLRITYNNSAINIQSNLSIMKKTIGGILSIGGLIGVIFFGFQYMQDSESFSVFGADVAVSTGDWVPILISAIVMVVGILLTRGE